MTSEVVPGALSGERLDRIVAMITGCSRSDAAAAVDKGQILVDGKPVTSRAQRIEAAQAIEWPDGLGPREAAPLQPDATVEVHVVYEDEHVWVIDKPAGLVVHPGAGHERGTLVHGLLALDAGIAGVGAVERPGIVHRLDKGTSGLMVVARSALAYEVLVAQLSAREVERIYLTLVFGLTEHSRGVIDAPVSRSRHDPTRMAVAADGRPARTNYEVVTRFTRPESLTFLRCSLETGRTHQVRVHLAAIGHAVVGDATYGRRQTAFGLSRQFLHATRLAFSHPATGEHLSFESTLPSELSTVLAGLS